MKIPGYKSRVVYVLCWLTNCHKLSGLKQQTFIHSRRPDVEDQGVGSTPNSLSIACLFQLLVGANNPWHSLACNCITLASTCIFTWPSSTVCQVSSVCLLQGHLSSDL